jgi:hypothetical protein
VASSSTPRRSEFASSVVLGGLPGRSGGATTSVISGPPPQPQIQPVHQGLSETPDDAFATGYVIGRYVGGRVGRSEESQARERYEYGISADDWCDADDWVD